MPVVLGFDPGGLSAFGWSVCKFERELPLVVVAQGTGDSAKQAVAAAIANVPTSEHVVAAAIDAPLCWAQVGDRVADQIVRDAVAAAGCPHPWGTVQVVNALRGACLVQGMLALRALRARFPDLPVSEAHPKALLWLLGIANAQVPVVEVGPHLPAVKFNGHPNDHERDAALGALTAWACVARPAGWIDLVVLEPEPFFPVGKVVYYMPVAEAAATVSA